MAKLPNSAKDEGCSHYKVNTERKKLLLTTWTNCHTRPLLADFVEKDPLRFLPMKERERP
ncbi:MAG: hypothetical protein KKF35_00110 [Gammaproteobacteria bacterium]|nr:hypothetical protein [Gammaproteobacteria bacterium]